MDKLKDKLKTKIAEENIVIDADMSKEVSFKAGGKADMLVTPQNIEELKFLLQVLDEEKVAHIIMGNGSNLLIKDGGYRGVVVKIAGEGFGNMEVLEDGLTVKVGAAVLMSTFARFLMNNSLAGFEFASGIPGSLGGAVFMNAGAYGGEIKDVLQEVTAISQDGMTEQVIPACDLDLGYRHSALHENGYIVVDATFKFEKGNKDEILKNINELGKKRNEKQPVNFPSAGSFFKRPTGYFAGKLVQDAGLKGYTVGGAQVSELHSGFVINIGGATATDIVTLMHHCQDTVYEKFGVRLEPEVQILGED